MKHNYQTAAITDVIRENDRITTFVLSMKLDASPGQYIMLWLPRVNEKPFGVAVPDPLTLTIAHVGPFTEALARKNVGDTLTLRGPYGNPFTVSGHSHLLVAGGYGIVPLYFLASRLSSTSANVSTVVIGAKTKTDLIYADKFRNLGMNVEITTDDGTAGTKGFSTHKAKELLDSRSYDTVYTCGPQIMMEKVAALSRDRNVPCQISMERYFRCGGMGLCGECSCKGKLACTDGPVFDGSMVL